MYKYIKGIGVSGMNHSRKGRLTKLYQKFFRQTSAQELPAELEFLEREMQLTTEKLSRSWNNFLYAHENFVDIAVLEIYHLEMEHSTLYKKILQLTKQREKDRTMVLPTREYLPWLRTDHL